jgi:cytochrome c peroxidase
MFMLRSERTPSPMTHHVTSLALSLFLSMTSATVSADESDDAAAATRPAASSKQLPNNFPFLNAAGTAATFSTAGFVDLANPFHVPQGSNGRSCESCHLVQAGWSIRPIDVELKFLLTNGTDPIFNKLDANTPNPDLSTRAKRYAAFSMLRKGLFRRGGTLPANAEFEIIAIDDPLGAGGSSTRIESYRRPLATANFHIARNIGWHDQNTNGSGDVHAGLVSQAIGNITGAQEGPPAAPETIASIVTYEEGLRFAQLTTFGAGKLTACGAQGGPENLSAQPSIDARFNLFDAWIGLVPGSCGSKSVDRKRAQIARGQEVFNSPANGGGCLGCHNAANNGSSVSGRLFDIGASRAQFREPGMPLYTLRHKITNETRQTTDAGRAIRTGLWSDVDRFKTPSLRGVAARAPYFHNGIAKTLRDVVTHYEVALGFQFTEQEREDLVAFMEAL